MRTVKKRLARAGQLNVASGLGKWNAQDIYKDPLTVQLTWAVENYDATLGFRPMWRAS